MRAHGTDAGLEQTEEVAHFCIDRACANVRVCIYTQIPVNGGNSISVCCVCVCPIIQGLVRKQNPRELL